MSFILFRVINYMQLIYYLFKYVMKYVCNSTSFAAAGDIWLRVAFLFFLVIPSVLIGYYAKDMIIGFGSDFWGNALFVTAHNMNRVDSEFIFHFYKILPVVLSLLGATISFLLYLFGSKLLVQLKISTLGKKVYNFFNKSWFELFWPL